MEVLKVGKKNVVECSKCGSELRFNDSDVKLSHQPVKLGPYDMDIPDQEDNYRPYVLCPVCKNSVSVPRNRSLITQLLRSRSYDD